MSCGGNVGARPVESVARIERSGMRESRITRYALDPGYNTIRFPSSADQ
jgi:hypothetical protein